MVCFSEKVSLETFKTTLEIIKKKKSGKKVLLLEKYNYSWDSERVSKEEKSSRYTRTCLLALGKNNSVSSLCICR